MPYHHCPKCRLPCTCMYEDGVCSHCPSDGLTASPVEGPVSIPSVFGPQVDRLVKEIKKEEENKMIRELTAQFLTNTSQVGYSINSSTTSGITHFRWAVNQAKETLRLFKKDNLL